MPEPERRFELLVLSHIDADHVEGAVPLLGDTELKLQLGEVWFNAWRHLPLPQQDAAENKDDRLGAHHGEFVSALLDSSKIPWNTGPIMVPETGPLPTFDLPGGMRLTLLSPTSEQLARLRPRWAKEAKEQGLQEHSTREALTLLRSKRRLQPDALGPQQNIERLASTDFDEDETRPNGSSIALLAEYQGKRLLLTADAYPSVLIRSLRRLLSERNLTTLPLDAFKLSHHGSAGNTNQELLEQVRCRRYLVSTSGSYFEHPDPEAIARVIMHGGRNVELYFNYASDETRRWADKELQRKYGFSSFRPSKDAPGWKLTF
jgi:hypothetical protein